VATGLLFSYTAKNFRTSESPGQSVEYFFCKINEEGKLLNKSEREMLSKFISGIPEQMSCFIRVGLPQDMQTALTVANVCGLIN
jgi:hypothetical protein